MDPNNQHHPAQVHEPPPANGRPMHRSSIRDYADQMQARSQRNRWVSKLQAPFIQIYSRIRSGISWIAKQCAHVLIQLGSKKYLLIAIGGLWNATIELIGDQAVEWIERWHQTLG